VVERGAYIPQGLVEGAVGRNIGDGVLQDGIEPSGQRVRFFFPCLSVTHAYLSSRRKLVAANALWLNLTPATVGQRDFTASTETVRRHALELQARDFTAVQAMERRLDILVRWQPESIEWKAAAEKVTLRRYQRCIDVLEGLIVARMFELTKMNMSQTGMSFYHCNCYSLPNTYGHFRLQPA